jgi:acetate kinase
VGLDADRNQSLAGEGEISGRDAAVPVFVVAAREDIEIARQVRGVVGPAS